MTLELLALGTYYTLCGVASVVVYVAIAILFHARLASKWFVGNNDPEYRLSATVFWPITGAVYFTIVLVVAGTDALAKPWNRLAASCRSMHRSLSEMPKPKAEVPETKPPEPATCDICREKLKQGTYR